MPRNLIALLVVATVLTVYGIETHGKLVSNKHIVVNMLQQYLPFTVLKRCTYWFNYLWFYNFVATVLTVYGIETIHKYEKIPEACGCNSTYRLRYWNLRPVGKNTDRAALLQQYLPFTVLKLLRHLFQRLDVGGLQQYLPFTVLKHAADQLELSFARQLQQYLPFTVLKLVRAMASRTDNHRGCNSTYRLRYWNVALVSTTRRTYLQVATVLTVYGIETK